MNDKDSDDLLNALVADFIFDSIVDFMAWEGGMEHFKEVDFFHRQLKLRATKSFYIKKEKIHIEVGNILHFFDDTLEKFEIIR